MVSRYVRLKVRRQIRSQKKNFEKVGEQAGEQFEANVLDRWRNLQSVQRFMFGWLLLIALLTVGVFLQTRELAAYHRTLIPVSGGTFREGVVGEITNVNPIFSTRASDRAATKLLFSTLFTYNDEGEVVGDLAKSYTVNKDGTVYNVVLRDDVKWHDGEEFTADDVVFTYEAIQHPDTRSYLNVAWRDIKVQMKSKHEVVFILPNTFTPFIHSLTQGGILPAHILGDLNPAQLRGVEFNTNNPIGTGPFKFDELLGEAAQTTVSERQLRMDKYEDYHLGEPRIDHFVLVSFSDREVMLDKFLAGELAAVGGLNTSDHDRVADNPSVAWYDLKLNNEVFVFFKTSSGVLKNANIRKALTRATDNIELQQILEGRYQIVDSPILPDQLGYSSEPEYTQIGFNRKRAGEVLEKEGYKLKQGDGYRYNSKGARLSIELVTQNSDDYPQVAAALATQWKEVGVYTDVKVVADEDIQRNHISPHSYGALLFGIALGSDPDPFVYWHSSQSGVNGFNLSEIKNATIDEALESGRTRTSNELRDVKYKTFLSEWRETAPAIALFRPAYLYSQRRVVNGFSSDMVLNAPEQRFNNVHLWRINSREGSRPY